MDSRIRGLDGIRAVAVLAVIAAHAHVPGTHGGGVGVDIFFTLSGFLITYLLLAEHRQWGSISISKFWLRRVLRLFPALIVMVIVVDLIAVVSLQWKTTGPLAESLPATPAVLLYFGNWMIVATSGPALGWFGPMWSLAVEEQFYLFWPLIVILALRARRGRAILFVVAAVGICVAVVARVLTFNGTNMYQTFGTNFRFDMLLVGVLLALLVDQGKSEAIRRVSRIAVWPSCALLIFVIVAMPDFNATSGAEVQKWYYWVGLPAVGVATASIIGFVLTHQRGRFADILEWRPLAYTGRISYGMYLWHYPVLMAIALIAHGKINSGLLFVIGLVFTYAISAASYRFVERPLHRRYREQLSPRPRVPASVD